MYKTILSEYFKNQLKKLAKKDPQIKNTFRDSILGFDKQKAISIGLGIYKLRIKKNNTGKSKGYRLYIFILEIEKILTPICIYEKNSKSNMTKKELTHHLEKIQSELKILT